MGCIFVGLHCLFVGFGGFCFNCDFVLGLVLICWFVLPFFNLCLGVKWVDFWWSVMNLFEWDFVLSGSCFVCFIARIISIVIGNG